MNRSPADRRISYWSPLAKRDIIGSWPMCGYMYERCRIQPEWAKTLRQIKKYGTGPVERLHFRLLPFRLASSNGRKNSSGFIRGDVGFSRIRVIFPLSGVTGSLLISIRDTAISSLVNRCSSVSRRSRCSATSPDITFLFDKKRIPRLEEFSDWFRGDIVAFSSVTSWSSSLALGHWIFLSNFSFYWIYSTVEVVGGCILIEVRWFF